MPDPLFKSGDIVQRINAADQVGVLQSSRWHPQAETFYYDVLIGGRILAIAESSLRAVGPVRSPWDDLANGAAAGAAAFRLSMTRSRVMRPPSRIAKSFSSARTQFYPHQFKPLLKLLHSTERRLLIADDVGLGKTIEAGYVLTELEAARPLEHVLVVVPARLRLKWQMELEKRFGQRFALVAKREVTAALAEGRTPPSFRWIASYETLRAMVDAIRLSPISIDCLIFDEAHRLRNPASLQHRLGALLCERAEAVIMLSATPIQTGLGDLYYLAKLLLPGEFSDRDTFDDQMVDNRALLEALRAMRSAADSGEACALALDRLDTFLGSKSGKFFNSAPVVERARTLLERGAVSRAELTEIQTTLGTLSPLSHFFTRTRKIEAIPDTPQRVAHWFSVELSVRERNVYDSIIEMCKARAAQTGWGADQSATMMYRAVASCIPAAMRHFQQELRGEHTAELDEPDDEVEHGTDIPIDLREQVRQAVGLFEQIAGTDSKLQVATRELDALWAEDARAGRPRRKCIIFSFFRGTVEYLGDRLRERNTSCVRVHGGIPPAERDILVNRFLEDPTVDVLVTSDVSAEGVDLQRASVLFNYDLPWNPMVVEQRVGRIDRIGQEAKVLTIANFVVKDSIEERILQRLFQRIRIFETSIGEMDALLGDSASVEQLTQKALFGTLGPDELEAQLRRAEIAFENQRQAAVELDARAGELLAVDQALLDEIRAATGEHQIPHERHVLEFVNRALDRAGAGVRVPSSALSQTARLDLRNAFRAQPFAPHASDGDRTTSFMRWAQQDVVALTFSREVAYRFPNVELIHATHPLARWAAAGVPAEALGFSVRLLRSDVLPPGEYMWGLSFLESPGNTAAMRMVGAIVSMTTPSLEITGHAEVAGIVGELLDDAREVPLPWQGVAASENVREAIVRARAALDGVAYTQNRREGELHALRESARTGRMRAGLNAAMDRAVELLARYRTEAAPAFVTRMQEAKVERARERLSAFDRQPVTRVWMDAERDDIAVGYLVVGGTAA